MNLIRYFLNVGSTEKDILCWAKRSQQNISDISKYPMSLYYLCLSFPMLKEQSTVTNLDNKNQNCGVLFSGTLVQKAYCIPTRTKNIVI